MKGNYDSIAWFYDRLARLIYGSTLVRAQQYLISYIPPASRIIIVGGGTGWILEEIAKLHPSGLTITYIDASEKMIALAKKRACGANTITFIAARIEEVDFGTGNPGSAYNVALTPFLFDNFTNSSLQPIFAEIDAHLKPNGLWLYCDFQNTGRFWQQAVLKVMYTFFRLSCGIEASGLPDADACFSKFHYNITGQQTFMNEFITARIYQKE